MANYIRPRVTGARIFFTVALQARGSSLLVDQVALLRQAVATTKAERPFEIDAWVVLPDHLHCVWTLPGGDDDFSTRWRLIKARFSRSLPEDAAQAVVRRSHLHRQERGIWQRRFWEHHIRDAADKAWHVAYCLGNPVRHGLVSDPRNWPYSSIHRSAR